MKTSRFITFSLLSFFTLIFSYYKLSAQENLQLSSNWDYTLTDNSSEKIHKMITSFDGSIVAVGETISKNKKYSDGLFLIHDPKTGTRIVKKQFGGSKHDGFKSIVQNYDGTFTVVGYTDGTSNKEKSSWIALIDDQGNLLKENKPIKEGNLSEELIDVAINLNGAVLAIGNQFSARQLSVWVMPINRELSGPKTKLKMKDFVHATAICAGKQGDFILAGNTFGKKRDQSASAWVMKVNDLGADRWGGVKYFGNKGIQNAYGICASSLNDGYVIVGGNNNASSGKQDMWLMKISEQGQVVWEKLYGGYEDDIATAVTKISEGGYAVLGHTKSYKLNAKYSMLKVIVIDDNGRQLSEKLESIYAAKGDNIAHAIIDLPSGEDVVIAASATHNDFSIPYLGAFTYQLRNPLTDLSLNALTLNEVTVEEANKDGFWSAKERGFAYLDITNTTDRRLYNMTVSIIENSIQSKIQYTKTIKLGTIPPKQSKRLVIPVQAKINLQEACKIDLAIQSGNNRILTTATISLISTAAPPTPIVATDKKETSPVPEDNENQDAGPAYIVWAKPDMSTAKDVIDIHKNQTEVRLIAVSETKLQKSRFAIEVNGVQRRGHKMDESTLTSGANKEQGQTEQSFSTTLHFEPGLNEVQIFYLDEDKETPIGSKSRKVTYNYILPDNPSLWVLSIGIEHQDLAYTKKDAEDFAKAYQGLGRSNGKGFKNVNVTKLTLGEDTRKINIQKVFRDLKQQAIKNGDLVVVFISSHGKISSKNSRFLLLPSDFDSSYEDLTALDFEEDILEQLRPVKGNKLVFVDACNSGGIGAKSFTDAATSKVMTDLLENTRGLEIFASCSSHEESYEDATWQNGAFTKAILEAFQDVTVQVEGQKIHADIYKGNPTASSNLTKGKDGVITIKELREYLKKRVPYLARKVKKKAQNPLMRSDRNLDHNMGIFMVY